MCTVYSVKLQSHNVVKSFVLQYLLEIPKWKSRCEDIQIPDTIQLLEDAISQHQTLIDGIMQAYTDVS